MVLKRLDIAVIYGSIRVMLDGVELQGIKDIEFAAGDGSHTKVYLGLEADEVFLVGEVVGAADGNVAVLDEKIGTA